MPGCDGAELRSQGLDLGHREMAEKVECEVDPVDRIGPNRVAEWLQAIDRPLQLRADAFWQLDGDENAPPLGLTAGRRCQPSP